MERMEKLEKKIEQLEAREKDREEQWRAEMQSVSQVTERAEDGACGVQRGLAWSIASGSASYATSEVRSVTSAARGWSGLSLSERDVKRMKKIVVEQDRKEKQDNIVIKGALVETNLEDIKRILKYGRKDF